MDLQHLRVLVRVSQVNSFTKAAVELGIAQPTVSRIIKELEETWDGQLFYRTGRGVALSDFGKIAVARASTILREAEQASEELRTYSSVPMGTVSLGLPTSLVGTVVPRLVNELRRDFAGIRLRVFEGFSDQIERWLSAGEVEIGLYSKYYEGPPRQDGELFAANLVLVGGQHTSPITPEINFSDVAKLPLVLPAAPNGLRMIIEAVARRLRVPLNVVVDADSVLAQKQICESCGCYMIKAPQTIADDQSKGKFTTSLIINPRICRYVVLVTTRQHPLTRAAREVASRATAILKEVS